MDINIKITYGEGSLHNLAFVKALLIKNSIENLHINYKQKEELRKEVIRILSKGVLNEEES